MRQVWITRRGGPEMLQLREAPDPQPGPGEVRIRVRAAGVNFADVMARRGLYPDAPPIPFVPGYEVAGGPIDWIKILLTFAVPYCVSTYGAVSYRLKVLSGDPRGELS